MSHFMDKNCCKLREDVYVEGEDRSSRPGGQDDNTDNTEVVRDITEDNEGICRSYDNNLLHRIDL